MLQRKVNERKVKSREVYKIRRSCVKFCTSLKVYKAIFYPPKFSAILCKHTSSHILSQNKTFSYFRSSSDIRCQPPVLHQCRTDSQYQILEEKLLKRCKICKATRQTFIQPYFVLPSTFIPSIFIYRIIRYGQCEDFVNYKPWKEGVKKLGR